MCTDFGVHLNGNFSLSSARSNISQSENDFLQADCDDTIWNQYILCDVLPDLHVKLIEHVLKFEEARQKKDKINFIPHDLWPIKNNNIGLYKNYGYGLNVITKLGLDGHKIFWTKAKGGQFISLQTTKFLKKEGTGITDILANLGIPAVELDEYKIKHLEEARSRNSIFKFISLDEKLVCKELKGLDIQVDHDSSFKLLNFILKENTSCYEILTGLPLVPLSNGSVGKFGDTYYVGKTGNNLDLFPNIGPSKFVSIKLPNNLLEIFNDDKFSEKTQIKKFDASAILDLLIDELPELSNKDLKWKPDRKSIPNKSWLEKIWSKLKKAEILEFDRISKLALLPMIQPSNMLVRPDTANPLLYIPENGHYLFPVLVKLQVRFTDMIIPENADVDFQKCVLECNPINIINSLKQICSLLSLNMNQLFEKGNLSPSDYKKFRRFVKEETTLLGK